MIFTTLVAFFNLCSIVQSQCYVDSGEFAWVVKLYITVSIKVTHVTDLDLQEKIVAKVIDLDELFDHRKLL